MINRPFGLRKPPFYPLNYEDQIGDERIDGSNEAEQVARRDLYHGAKDRFRLDLPEKTEII